MLCHPGPQLEDSEVEKSRDLMFQMVPLLFEVGCCLDTLEPFMWPLGIVYPYGMTSALSAWGLASIG